MDRIRGERWALVVAARGRKLTIPTRITAAGRRRPTRLLAPAWRYVSGVGVNHDLVRQGGEYDPELAATEEIACAFGVSRAYVSRHMLPDALETFRKRWLFLVENPSKAEPLPPEPEMRMGSLSADACEYCGGSVQQPAMGRRRKYCGGKCREQAKRAMREKRGVAA